MSGNRLENLEGESHAIPSVAARTGNTVRPRQLLAFGLLLVSLVAVFGFVTFRLLGSSGDERPVEAPDVASARVTGLRMPEAPPPAASAPPTIVVPKIEQAEPIPVQGAGNARKPIDPEDAPLFAGGTPTAKAPATSAAGARTPADDAEATLDAYQRQLQASLGQLQKLTGGQAPAGLPGAGTSALPPATGPLFGSMDRSATPQVAARQMADRRLILPKGNLLTCALKTRVVTAASGFVGCQLVRNVYSEDRVLLAERGSHLDGEYRIVQVRPGVTRVPVLWTRLRTPLGVTVDLDSPATGPLGESGLGGYVDNQWGERIGAALLLSVIDDSIRIAVTDRDGGSSENTIVMPNTAAQGSKLAEKVLETTINIPPLLYQNQGGVVGVYVARDVDFSSVYQLRPTELARTGAASAPE